MTSPLIARWRQNLCQPAQDAVADDTGAVRLAARAARAHVRPERHFDLPHAHAALVRQVVRRVAGPALQRSGFHLGRFGSTVPASVIGTQVLPTAQRYLGVNYRYGGASPATGFDCSGFVQYVFARHDVRLPAHRDSSRALAFRSSHY